MPAPERFIEHLKQHGYHPRSDRHGNALCQFVMEDLLTLCPRISQHASNGLLVYGLNREIIVGNSNWNIDLVLGPPEAKPDSSPGTIQNLPPTTIRIAIEAKSVMTEHGKARRNRLRDLDSFHQFVHRYDSQAIAAGLMILNIAPQFRSPLRPEVSVHRNVRQLVEQTIGLLRTLPARSTPNHVAGLEAIGVIVVHHDNLGSQNTRLVTGPPAPQTGDPIHYRSFVQRICDRYTQRWS